MSLAAAHPEPFRRILADLEEHVPPRRLSDVCFGCGPAHPRGLRVRCYRTSDGVVAPLVIAAEYQGPPGTAHGGIVAAALDEVLASAVARALGRIAITGELTVRYVKPVPTDTPLLLHARMVHDHERYVDAEGHIENVSQQILATARGRFFPQP